MKIIATDKITTLTPYFNAINTYVITNVSNRFPSKMWISTSTWEHLTITNANNKLGGGVFVDDELIDSITYRYFRTDNDKSISGITKNASDPIVITTSATHGLSVDDYVYITGITGTWELNYNIYQVRTVPTTSTFTIKDTSGNTITSNNVTAWSSGGTIQYVYSQGTMQGGWADLTYNASTDSKLILILHNTTDINSISIANWVSAGSNTLGRFETSGASPVSLEDTEGNSVIPVGTMITLSHTNDVIESIAHTSGQSIRLTMTAHPFAVGDYVRISGSGATTLDNRVFYVAATTSNTIDIDLSSSINSNLLWVDTTITTGNCRKLYQITSITGNGTGASGVTLSPSPATASATVADMLRPIQTGVIRCGLVDAYNNPMAGMQERRSDYGIRITTENGRRFTRKRNIARAYDCAVITTDAEYVTLMDFYDSIGPTPFAALVLDDMSDNNRHAIFCGFDVEPSVDHAFKRGTHKRIQLSLSEVL